MASEPATDATASRRHFLQTLWCGAGSAVVLASLPAWRPAPVLAGARGQPGRYRFPQGLASGDPAPDSVVLWTRVEATDGADTPVPLRLEVAEDSGFSRLVADQRVTASRESDFTVRVLVRGLAADTTYHYRFSAGADVTPHIGRTRTAPDPEADRLARFAFASCQSYEAGHYGVWRALVDADELAPPAEQIDAVLHLGDFVYEALGYGAVRRVPPLPDGGGAGDEGRRWARTLADYRHLYKTYLSDPDLQAARARFPFIVTWDDHEFSDDAWQATATYGNRDVAMPARRLAASQAWFEFIPARLSTASATESAPNPARDFTPVRVSDAVGDDTTAEDVANAIAAITIYRTLRWGRHAELVVTDTRSYRSDHPVPDAIGVQLSPTGRYLLPRPLVEVCDAGRAANDGNPPASLTIGAATLPNLRRAEPPGTMLGERQKAWWKQVMSGSSATWKLWLSSVPVQPVWFDIDRIQPGATTAVFSTDTWDGYPGERRELLQHLAASAITNVVVLSGDNHNTFAGTLAPEHPERPRDGVAVEFSIAGISSPSIFEAFAGAIAADDPMRALVVFDGTRFGGADARCPALNVTLRHGVQSTLVLQGTGDPARARAATNPRQNPHLAYMDTTANGIGVIALDATGCRTALWTFPPPVSTRFERLRVATFSQPVWRAGQRIALDAPQLDGTPPFPDDRP